MVRFPAWRSRISAAWPGAAGLLIGGLLTAGVLPVVISGGRGPAVNVVAPGDSMDGVGPTDAGRAVAGSGDAASPAPLPAGSGAGSVSQAPAPPTGSAAGGAAPDGRRSDGGRARPAEESIRIGVLLIDLGGVSRIGFAAPGLDPRDQRRWYEVFVEELNRSGGVGGREVKATYATYDPTSGSSMRAACLTLTEDAHVLAVLENTGGYRGSAVLCFTREHRTPFLSTFHRHNDDEMRQSGELLLGYGMSASRNLANLVHELDGLGQLKGRRIGLLESARPGDERTNDAGLIGPLRGLGREVVKRYVTSEDLNVAASQIPIAVREMQAAGVDGIFLNTNVLVATQFVNAAEGQLYRPSYFTSEWYGLSTDFGGGQMPPAFDGSFAVVAERDGEYNTPGRAEPPADRNCRETVKGATGEDYALDSDQNALVTQTCGVVRLFGAGARATTDLTALSLSRAIQGLGHVDPPRVGPGLFSPGRLDAASQVRVKRWSGDCRCWRITRDFRPARL